MRATRGSAALYTAVNRVAEAMIAGRLDVRADASSLTGAEAELLVVINRMLESLISPMRLAAGALDEIAHGRIPAFVLDEQQGEYGRIKQSINTLLAVLYGMHRETLHLTDSVRAGQLRTRGNDWDYEGIWKELISGMNRTLDAVVDPVEEAGAVLGRLAGYDLRARMHGKYRGDHAVIRDAMNVTAETLRGAISQVTDTVELATGVGRSVMNSSATVSDGAREQSRRLVETTRNLDRLAASARDSANNTEATRRNAQAAADEVTNAKRAMERMLVAMAELGEAAERTATVVGEIDAIAKQTRTLSSGAGVKAIHMQTSAAGFAVVAREIRKLSTRCSESSRSIRALERRMESDGAAPSVAEIRALGDDLYELAVFSKLLGMNAAVEAAHVEGAGVDFGEVTEEIRGLAERSAEASARTESLIDRSVKQAHHGARLAREIDEHLARAAEGAEAISRLTADLAAATTEQATGIAGINEAASQISLVTQKNTASAAESLGAARDLSGQMDRLSTMVRKFRV